MHWPVESGEVDTEWGSSQDMEEQPTFSGSPFRDELKSHLRSRAYNDLTDVLTLVEYMPISIPFILDWQGVC